MPHLVILYTGQLDAEVNMTSLCRQMDDDIGLQRCGQAGQSAFVLQHALVFHEGDIAIGGTFAGARNKLVKITFPPLPAGATRLQLGEANCQPKPDSDMDYWCFKNIVLPAR